VSTVTPELYELVKKLLRQGFRVLAQPWSDSGDPIDYEVSVQLDGLTTERLSQLLSITSGAPYKTDITNGWLVLKPNL
jgi:hypothetical protein